MTRQPDAASPGASPEPGPEGGAGRWAWRFGMAAAALLYAGLAMGSGLDRMARTDPRFAAAVPGPFRANADRSAAQLALMARNYPAMQAHATDALRHDPLNTSSAALLGWSQFAGGKEEAATAAFKVAGQLGWRDPLTQIYWFAAAMQQNDYPVAAMRIDALLRQNPQNPQRDAALYELEQIPEGRVALVERMQERPDWLEVYTSDIQPLPPPAVAARALTLMDLARHGTRLGCEGIAKFVVREVSIGQLTQAKTLRASHCGGATSGLLSDGSFALARTDRLLTPFDWEIAADGSLDITLLTADGAGKGVKVGNNGAVTRPFASQLIAVGPGRYRLTGRITGDDKAAIGRFGVALACNQGGLRELFGGVSLSGDRFAVSFTVPQKCPTPWLELTMAPGQGHITITGLDLKPE